MTDEDLERIGIRPVQRRKLRRAALTASGAGGAAGLAQQRSVGPPAEGTNGGAGLWGCGLGAPQQGALLPGGCMTQPAMLGGNLFSLSPPANPANPLEFMQLRATLAAAGAAVAAFGEGRRTHFF